MDEHRTLPSDRPAGAERPGEDTREPYEPPALESLGGVYGQTQLTG